MASCADFKSYHLYQADGRLGFRLVRLVSRATGRRMERAGTVEACVEQDGETLCFVVREAPSAPVSRNRFSVVAVSTPVAASSQPSSAVFSRGEVEAIAGTKFSGGRSLTSRMTEEQRLNRISRKSGRRLPPEDLVERATNKLKAWEELRRVAAQRQSAAA